MKIELFSHRDAAYICVKKVYNLKNSVPSVKHGGGSILLCGRFNASGPVEGIMKEERCVKILKENMKKSAAKLGLEGHLAG